MKGPKSEEEYATSGPLTAIFGNPVARVLDQALYVGNMEQTISMLADSTCLSYKTVQSVVKRLESMGVMRRSRRIGNAQAYRFEVENELHDLIECAQRFQLKRLARVHERRR